MTAHRLEDFRRSRQGFSAFASNIHFLSYLLYRDPLFNTRGAFIIRKGYGHIEKIDIEFMWLDAFGLQEPEEEIRRNTGIWVPYAGQCDLKETKKPCKLPSGSKMYSWANREKVNPYYFLCS